MKEILDLLKAGKTREEIISMVDLECTKYERYQELEKAIENYIRVFGALKGGDAIAEIFNSKISDSTKFATNIW